MYAIVRIGNRQYQVEEGRMITVEKLPYEVGETIEFDDVLLVSDGDAITVGQPNVKGASVDAEVVSQFKGKKIIVYKYRSGTGYRRKQGHRQKYTRLMINSVNPG